MRQRAVRFVKRIIVELKSLFAPRPYEITQSPEIQLLQLERYLHVQQLRRMEEAHLVRMLSGAYGGMV